MEEDQCLRPLMKSQTRFLASNVYAPLATSTSQTFEDPSATPSTPSASWLCCFYSLSPCYPPQLVFFTPQVFIISRRTSSKMTNFPNNCHHQQVKIPTEKSVWDKVCPSCHMLPSYNPMILPCTRIPWHRLHFGEHPAQKGTGIHYVAILLGPSCEACQISLIVLSRDGSLE